MYNKVTFTQINAKKGIKLLVEIAIAAMFQEYKHLGDGPMPGKPVVTPFNLDVLTPLDKRKTLEDANLIKEKLFGKIKGRTCANGRKQRNHLKPDESVYSPTCSTKALTATLFIYQMEQRDVTILDLPGYFLQTALPSDKFFLMRIRDEFVDVMCEVNPEYIPQVRYENGKKILYVNILRDIYECIE